MPRPERPVDPEAGPVQLFAVELRELRRTAGSPGYRELAARAHYSATTLAQAARGDRLPSLAVTLAFVRACGGDPAAWERRWRVLAEDHDEPPGDARAPYVGLAAFQPDDRDLFFGRNQEIARLMEKVSQQRLVAVVGASGSGKSSLLRAGLLPAAHGCSAVLTTPGAHPLRELAIRLSTPLGVSAAGLAAELAEHPPNLGLAIRQMLMSRSNEPECLLVVDQFEEVFTLAAPDERERFVAALLCLVVSAEHRTRVVLGLRADFYAHCAQHPQLATALEDAQVVVGPMSTDGLRRAITQPAVRVGCTVETALVARLVADATDQPGVLPLVSHALLQTWQRRRGNTLTLAGYEASGGIHRAVARSADQAFDALTAERQDVARQVFLRLTIPGEGTEDTKRRIDRDELDNENPNTAATLEHLAAARLITLDNGSVELAHEALIRSWPRFQRWLTENRQGLRIHRQLTDATSVWDAHQRDPGALYRGARLAIAYEWAGSNPAALTPREREFLQTSLTAETAERTTALRRTRRLRRLVALLAVLLLIAAVAVGNAVTAQHTATDQRNAALTQKVIREATALRATNPALALQLALAAYRTDPTPAARDTLHSMFATPYASRITEFQEQVWSMAMQPRGTVLATSGLDGWFLWDISDPLRLRRLSNIATPSPSMDFSADGRLLAMINNVTGYEVVDVTNPAYPIQFMRIDQNSDSTVHLSPAESVAFGPRNILATTDVSGTMRLWDITSTSRSQLLARTSLDGAGGGGSRTSVISNPVTSTLATFRGGTIQLWDVSDPRRPALLTTLSARDSAVSAMTFNSAGTMLAATSSDGTIQLWDISDPRRPTALASLAGQRASVFTAAFNPEGTMLATAGADGTILVWDLADPRNPAVLTTITGHTTAVTSVTFSADGRTLISGSVDRTVRLTDISLLTLASHTGTVRSMAYSHDGKRLVTTDDDLAVHLWDMSDRRRPRKLSTIRHENQLLGAVLSPDGLVVATAGPSTTSSRGLVRLWDVRDPGQPRRITDLTVEPITVVPVFSPDGKYLVTPHRLWDISDSSRPQELGSFIDSVWSMALSADGRILIMAGAASQKIRIWDISDPKEPLEFATLPVSAQKIQISPNGTILAATGLRTEGTQLWDVSNPHEPQEIVTIRADERGETNNPFAVGLEFSPDGRMLATANAGQSPRLWDVTNPRSPREVAILTGHPAATAVAFSPDGTTVVTAGYDRAVRLWDTDVNRVAERVCEVAWPRMTRAEWEQYFPGLDFRAPCPG